MNHLDAIGWQNFFQQQLAREELEERAPARVSAVHRSEIELHDSKESTRIKRNFLPVADIATGCCWMRNPDVRFGCWTGARYSILAGSRLATSGIREDDTRGRHTTTYRSLHPLADGGVLIDSPGMRELQVANIEHGLEEVFSEIVTLAVPVNRAAAARSQRPVRLRVRGRL